MRDGSAGRGTQTAHRLDTGGKGFRVGGTGWGEKGEGAWEDQARMDPCMNLRASEADRARSSEKSRLRVFETVCVPWVLGGRMSCVFARDTSYTQSSIKHVCSTKYALRFLAVRAG